MKKIFILFILLIYSTFLYAEVSAIISEVSGKVEIKSVMGNWKTAEPGMKISKGDLISTGFRAQAVLEIGPSQLIVKQLTRMELEELVEKEGTISTGLNLRVGKIKAEVRTTEGLRQNFTLTSPVSTAAVRGTSFEYDGVSLKVIEGTVIFTNRRGQSRAIQTGEISRITGGAIPQTAEEIKEIMAMIDPSTVNIEDIKTIIGDLSDILENYSNISIIINWN